MVVAGPLSRFRSPDAIQLTETMTPKPEKTKAKKPTKQSPQAGKTQAPAMIEQPPLSWEERCLRIGKKVARYLSRIPLDAIWVRKKPAKPVSDKQVEIAKLIMSFADIPNESQILRHRRAFWATYQHSYWVENQKKQHSVELTCEAIGAAIKSELERLTENQVPSLTPSKDNENA